MLFIISKHVTDLNEAHELFYRNVNVRAFSVGSHIASNNC